MQKMSERVDEDALLFDAAEVVSQRRKRDMGKNPGEAGQQKGEYVQDKDGAGEGGEVGESASRADGPRKLRKFAHTGWFHSYE